MDKLYGLETLTVKNFKLFSEEFTVNFNGNGLVVFDGPNGHGKTTIYDAIELALTGNIRRLAKVESRQIPSDVVVAYNDNRDCFVRLKLSNGINSIELERRLKSPIPKDATKISNFSALWKLYKIKKGRRILISQNDLNELVGNQHLHRDFSLFHYVEQEDTAHFLKTKNEVDRAKALSVLFGDTVEMQQKVAKVEKFEKRILEIIKGKKQEKGTLEQRGNLTPLADGEVEPVKYEPLLTSSSTQFEWDQEFIGGLSVEKRDSFLLELQSIDKLVKHRMFFLAKRAHVRAMEQNEVLRGFIAYSQYINQYESLKKDSKTSILIENVLSLLKTDKFDLLLAEQDLHEVFKIVQIEASFKENFMADLTSIVEGKARNSASSMLVVELLNHRNNLKSYLDTHEKDKDVECLFCGTEFKDKAKLKRKVNEKESALRSLLSDDAQRVQQLQADFLRDSVAKLTKILTNYLSRLSYPTKEHLIELESAIHLCQRFDDLELWLNKKSIEYSDLLFTYKPENNSRNEINNNIALLKSRIFEKVADSPPSFDNDSDECDFERIYSVYFGSQSKLLEALNIEHIQAKTRYIQKLYMESITSDIKAYKKLKTEITNLSSKKTYVNNLKKSLKTLISRYQKRLIKGIEIPFYIYSGKILQAHQSGLGNGIFIKDKTGGDELKNIRFVSNWDSDHDVLNTMSSGQIAAIVISLYLALNKVYCHGLGTILIDDPVQTMDEINMISLVELLRNEFSDRQIILSTHEDHVARYFLYKFLKYKRSVRQVKLMDRKEYQLSNGGMKNKM